MAWEVLTPGELAAVKGEEPYATVLTAELPLPPTRDEARSAAAWQYEHDRLALKRAMVYRTSRAKLDHNRITAENNRQTAALARHIGAPEVFCRYLELLAGDNLSRRQQYALNQALNYMLHEVYDVDALQIRYVSESLNLQGVEHTLFLLQMPVHAMYDDLPESPVSVGQTLADIQLMTELHKIVARTMQRVHDKVTADAAALELQQLLPLWNSAQQTRMQLFQGDLSLSTAETLALRMLETTMNPLMNARKRLAESQWYGSKTLQLMDELLR